MFPALAKPAPEVKIFMACFEGARLLDECIRIEQIYGAGIDALTNRPESTSAPEFMKLRASADQIRIDSEVARLDFDSISAQRCFLVRQY